MSKAPQPMMRFHHDVDVESDSEMIEIEIIEPPTKSFRKTSASFSPRNAKPSVTEMSRRETNPSAPVPATQPSGEPAYHFGQFYEATDSETLPRGLIRNADGSFARVTHRRYFTFFLLFANFGIFALEMWSNDWKFEKAELNPMFGPPTDVLLDWGAKWTSLVLDGEAWRLFTAMFVHAGIIHVVMNMVGVYRLVGSQEQEYGSYRVAFIYIISGIFGNVMSSIFLSEALTVGASGALYGMVGSLWGDFLLNHQYIGNKCSYTANMLVSSLFGLILGLFPLLDNFTHVFGFLWGILLSSCVFFPQADTVTGNVQKKPCVKFTSALLVAVFSLTAIIVLFTSLDGNELCTWCEYINCVDTPWWDCDTYGKPMVCEVDENGNVTDVCEPL